MTQVTAILAIFLAAASVQAHLGISEEEIQAEISAKRNFIAELRYQSLAHCEKVLQKRDELGPGFLHSTIERRMAKVAELRKKLKIKDSGRYHTF